MVNVYWRERGVGLLSVAGSSPPKAISGSTPVYLVSTNGLLTLAWNDKRFKPIQVRYFFLIEYDNCA